MNLMGARVSDFGSFAGLRSLEHLNCALTEIADLTPLNDLNSLSDLSIENCRIVKVPSGFWHEPSLEYLIIMEASLPDIPEEMLRSQDFYDENCLPALRAYLAGR